MIRATGLVAALSLLALAAPAQGFETCTYDAGQHRIDATLGADPSDGFVRSGNAIHTLDGGACGAATVLNTDKIVVTGEDNRNDSVTIDLSGGPFAPGFTTGGAEGASPEIEFEIDLQDFHGTPADIVVLGTPGVDHITYGAFGGFLSEQSAINLNADEAGLVDADVRAVGERTDKTVAIFGRGSGDVLNSGGGDGIPVYSNDVAAPASMLHGEEGNDDLTTADTAIPGPGNDTVRFVPDSPGTVSYFDAPGATHIAPTDGTTSGGWGGAPNDGEGGADTYEGPAASIIGSDLASDVFVGSALGDGFSGNGGADTIDGNGGADGLDGGEGGDTIHGGDGTDDLYGDAGNDHLFGDDGADRLEGREGDDEERGGGGNDRIVQTGGLQQPGPYLPNGADDIHGGDGIDALEYGAALLAVYPPTPPVGRDAPVFVDLDDVADDGASGEGDNAHSDLENVIGGAANDTLVGDGDANELRGWAGADTIRGGDGDDALYGLGGMGFFAEQTEARIPDGGDTIEPGAGDDLVHAGAGDDTIEARDGAHDTVNCGAGADGGRGDRIDTINADCEGIALPVEMPADPPVTPPVDPPVTPPVVVPPVVVPPVVVAPPPKVSTLLTLPSSRRCASRRKFTVRVRREIRGQVRAVTIFVNGRRVKRVAGRRIALPIDLRGLPKGRVRVRLRVELTDGRVATDTRTYRTCATKKRRGQFGRRRG